MTNIEKAIERMEKTVTACDDLILMARVDLTELRSRKKRALTLLEGLRQLPLSEEYRQMVEETAAQLANREPQTLSCMGVGIKV